MAIPTHYCTFLPDYVVQAKLDNIRRQLEAEATGGSARALEGPNQLVILEKKLADHLELQGKIRSFNFVLPPQDGDVEQGTDRSFPGSGLAEKSIPAEPSQGVYNPRLEDARSARKIKNLPGEKVEKNFDGTSADVYDHTQSVYQFYREVLHRDSLDNKHLRLIGLKYTLINFSYANAFWHPYFKQMVYGDGDKAILTNITGALDVCGHELTHGVVSNTCDLNYEGESGALNESVADVFGILSKQYHLKITIGQSDWIIGAGTVPNGPGLRTFKAGQANDDDIQPKTVEEWHKKLEDPNFKRYLSYDSGATSTTQILSGIPNHAFYLFSVSLGADTHAYDVPAKVWYGTITSKEVKKNANFVQFATASVHVANSVYLNAHNLRRGGKDVADKLVAAWKQVGVAV